MTRTPLIAGNWKMNGTPMLIKDMVLGLAQKYDALPEKLFEMLICPPFTLIGLASEFAKNTGIMIGGQDCSALLNGAHTGDISALMLKEARAKYVILGHSERRADHGESSALVKAKAGQALKEGLKAIICVGETETQKDKGETLKVVGEQVCESLPFEAKAGDVVIAYEPVWAIGTGRTPTNAEVEEVHAFIREQLTEMIGLDEARDLRILYGGSVKPSNARELLHIPNVDGALVGGASLKLDDFWGIAQAYL